MSRLFFMPKAVRINSAGDPYAGAKANFYLTGTTTRTNTYTDNDLGVAHDNPVIADSLGQFAPIYLDPAVTYRLVLTDSSDNQLDDVDPVHVPFDASGVSVQDVGGYFVGSNVEAVLQDIGANYALLSADEDISGDWTVSGSVNFQDNILQRPMVQDFGILTQDVSSSSGTATINLQLGNSVKITLTENTTMALTNPTATDDLCQVIIKITQDDAGGAYTVTWPGSVDWGSGTAPTMSTGNGAVDVYMLKTWDGGTTWLGDYVQAYA